MYSQNHYNAHESPLGTSHFPDPGCRNVRFATTRGSYLNTSPPRAPNAPTPSTSMSFRYYQPPKSKRPASESEEESSEEELPRTSRRASTSNASQKRGACTHCKGLKVRCHFSPGQTTCQRCASNNLQCTVIGRKKRRAVASHEELLLRSHKQDQQIVELLRQFDELTVEMKVRNWVGKTQTKTSHTGRTPEPSLSPSSGSSHIERDATGWAGDRSRKRMGSPSCSSLANIAPSHIPPPPPPLTSERFSVQELRMYFPDATATQSSIYPEVVARNIVHPSEVAPLFTLYFQLINPFFSLLDPLLHTPEKLFWRSPFLFTTICCVATRYSEPHASRSAIIAEFARDLGGQALVSPRKTIEDCQAFLVQSVYPRPRKHFDDQRSWLTMGLAFSIALELKLNDPPRSDELAEFESADPRRREDAHRRYMDRIRTWLNCYCMDASHATQFGKPAMLDMDDYVASSCRDWYMLRGNLKMDVHLVAYVELSKLMRRFRLKVESIEAEEKEQPGRPKKVQEVVNVVWEFHAEILRLKEEWSRRFAEHPQADDYICRYRADNNRMINAFNRLVLLGYGLQRVISANISEEGAGASCDHPLVRRCVETAKEVIRGMTEKLYPTGLLRFGMEAHFLFVTFAAAHLLSLQRPKMRMLLRADDAVGIVFYVRELVKVLQAQEVSKDARGQHAPFRYARYLSRQLKPFADLLPRDTQWEGDSRHASFQAPPARGSEALDMTTHGHRQENLSASWATSPIYTDLASAGNDTRYHHQGTEWPHGAPAQHALYDTFISESTTPLSPESGQGADIQGSNSLSGYPVDYSLLSFVNQFNDPTLSKATPPPGEPEPVQQWWQQMYPVSHACAPEGMDWPMMTVADGHRTSALPDPEHPPTGNAF